MLSLLAMCTFVLAHFVGVYYSTCYGCQTNTIIIECAYVFCVHILLDFTFQ